MRKKRTQKPQKIKVWAGIPGNSTVGSIFFRATLTSEAYLNVSENIIYPLIGGSGKPASCRR